MRGECSYGAPTISEASPLTLSSLLTRRVFAVFRTNLISLALRPSKSTHCSTAAFHSLIIRSLVLLRTSDFLLSAGLDKVVERLLLLMLSVLAEQRPRPGVWIGVEGGRSASVRSLAASSLNPSATISSGMLSKPDSGVRCSLGALRCDAGDAVLDSDGKAPRFENCCEDDTPLCECCEGDAPLSERCEVVAPLCERCDGFGDCDRLEEGAPALFAFFMAFKEAAPGNLGAAMGKAFIGSTLVDIARTSRAVLNPPLLQSRHALQGRGRKILLGISAPPGCGALLSTLGDHGHRWPC